MDGNTTVTEARIKQLAEMRAIEYEKIRESEAKSLNLRVSLLDEEVKKYQKEKDKGRKRKIRARWNKRDRILDSGFAVDIWRERKMASGEKFSAGATQNFRERNSYL